MSSVTSLCAIWHQELTEERFKNICDIYVEAFNGAPWFESWDAESASSYLRTQMRKTDVLTIEQDNLVIGFAFCLPLDRYEDAEAIIQRGANSTDYYVSEVAVAKNWRKKKISHSIFEQIIEYARSRFSHVTLRTRNDHAAMIHLMEHHRFASIAEYSASSGGVESKRTIYRFSF